MQIIKQSLVIYLHLEKIQELFFFLLIDTIDKIKKIEFEPWYKSEVNNNFGIYLGNGISEQFSIKTTQKLDEMKKDIPDGFGFVIKRGRVQYVKFLEEFDEKEI